MKRKSVFICLLFSILTPITGLTSLTNLSLAERDVDNTEAALLSGLTELTYLGLARNPVTNLDFLTGMSDLATLYMFESDVSDISGLAGLLNLSSVWLTSCDSLDDIGPLVTNAAAGGLGTFDTVYLTGTTLSAQGNLDATELADTYDVTVNL